MGPRALAAAATVAALGWVAALRAGSPAPLHAAAPAAADEAVARRACTGCHALPAPDVLPREAWSPKIYEMAGLAMAGIGAPQGAKAAALADFDVDAVERFYTSRAPLSLASPEPWPPIGEGSPPFRRHGLKLAEVGLRPAVANVRFLDLDGRGELSVVATDMANGLVLRASPTRTERGLTIVERVPAPCHVALVDLDRDGRRDLLLADLGDVPPADHVKGSVVWLQRLEGDAYRKHTLAGGLPRIADVEAADLDGDGDLDLSVAAFGWREKGSLLLFENRTQAWSEPVFRSRTLDARAGSIHVPPVDIDGDGRLDIVTLFSQHHETVVAFLGAGDGVFRPRALYAAPHPSWGSSGIDVADLDGDGDRDVVLSHGDMLDDFLLKPYHGVQWLENRGRFPFTAHALAALNGVHGARAVDLDGDHDLDILAVAFVPAPPRRGQAPSPALPSLVWLEQVTRGRFERRTLEVGGRHVSVDAADYDGDGDIDLVTGTFWSDAETWIEVWENLRVLSRPAHQGNGRLAPSSTSAARVAAAMAANAGSTRFARAAPPTVAVTTPLRTRFDTVARR